jgi:pimeloyl-ACP methyl ester carboxylesterase
MGTFSTYLLLFLLAGVASWYLMPLKWMTMLSRLSRRVMGMRTHERTVGGVLWHYFEGGKGPDMVILHGLAAEGDHWLGVAGPLRKQFRVIVPDLPGFGNSEAPAGLDFHIEAQSLRLEALLDELGIGQCILAGNSMGAWISANFAARNPGRVRAVWLQAPFGVLSAEPSEIISGLELEGANPFTVNTVADYRNLVGLMFHKPPQLPYPIARAGFLNARRLRDEMPRMQREVLEESVPLETLAPQLDMPVLVEWGRADRAVSVSGAAVLERLVPHAEIILRENIGHLPLLECPAQSADSFLKFAGKHNLADN